MNKLMTWISVARDYTVAHIDKLVHFLAGAVLCAYVLMFVGPLVAIGLTVVAAVLKEMTDSLDGGDVELLDIVATVAGGALTLCVYWAPQLWQFIHLSHGA